MQWFKEGRQAAAVQAAALKPPAAEGTPQAEAATKATPSAVKSEPAAPDEPRHADSAGTADHKRYVNGCTPLMYLAGPASCRNSQSHNLLLRSIWTI